MPNFLIVRDAVVGFGRMGRSHAHAAGVRDLHTGGNQRRGGSLSILRDRIGIVHIRQTLGVQERGEVG